MDDEARREMRKQSYRTHQGTQRKRFTFLRKEDRKTRLFVEMSKDMKEKKKAVLSTVVVENRSPGGGRRERDEVVGEPRRILYEKSR